MALKSYAHLRPDRRQDQEEKPWSLSSEFVRAVGTGARATAQSIAELPKIIPGVDYEVTVPEFGPRPQTVGGDIAAAMVQFAVPYAAVLKGVSLGSKLFGAGRAAKTAADAARAKRAFEVKHAAKAGKVLEDAVVPVAKPLTRRQKIVKYAGAGAAADFIAFSPNDPTLGNFIQGLGGDKVPVVNAISDLLATDEDDSDALNRFRHVLEGLGLGAAVPVVLKGLGKGLSLSGQAVNKTIPYAKDSRGNPIYAKDDLGNTIYKKNIDGSDKIDAKGELIPEQINRLDVLRENTIATLDKTRQNFVDNSHAVRLIDEMYEKFNPNKPNILRNGLNAYKERRLLVDTDRMAKTTYREGVYKRLTDGTMQKLPSKARMVIEQDVEKVVATTKDPVDTARLYSDYLYARQAVEHNVSAKKSGIDDDTIERTIARVEALPYNIKNVFKQSVTDLKAMNKDILHVAYHEGLIDAAALKSMGKVVIDGIEEDRLWIPMLRQGDDEAVQLTMVSMVPKARRTSKIQIRRKDLKKLSQDEIREYNIANPLNDAYVNMELGYDHIIKTIAENRAKRAMYDTIIELGEHGTRWAEKSTKSTVKITKSGGELTDSLIKQGVNLTSDVTEDKIFNFFTSKFDIKNNTDIIYRDGKAELWDIKDSLLMDSLASMGPQLTGDISRFAMRHGGKFKNFLTRMVTSSPTFFFGTNFARDTLSVGILMKGFIPFISSYRGLYHQLRNTDIAKRLEVSGGSLANRAYGDFSKSRDFQSKNAARIHTISGPRGLNKVVGFVDKWTSKFEMASRTEAFRLFTKQGYSDSVAAFKAREIAVDFAQHGSNGQFRLATSTVPFLNATIQGLDRTLRALGGKTLVGKKLTAEEADEVGRAWTNLMAVTTVGGVLLPMAHYTSPDESIRTTYDEIPKYMKDTNFVWVTPKIDGKNQILLLPKPFDFGIIPTIAEKFLDEEFIESDAMVVREYLRTAFLNSTRLGDASLAPQFIRPLIELRLNKKFTGAPIIPRNKEGGTIAQRRFWTSPTATFFADVAGSQNFLPEWTKSPLAVEHILNSYFGTVGGFVMDYISDPAFRGFLKLPDKPMEPEGSRWPWEEGARGLGKVGKVLPIQVKSDALSTTRSVNELYDAFNKARSFKIDFDSVKNNLDGFTQRHFQEMIKDPETMFFLTQYPMLEQTLDNLAKINKSIELLARTNPGDLSGRDNLLQTKQQISRQIMKVYYGQSNTLAMRQQGMADGGLVERNPDEFSTAEGPTMHPAIEKYLGKNSMLQQGMKDGGLVERPVQGMANGGLATNFNLISPAVQKILEANGVNIDGALIIAGGTSQFESNNDVNAKQSLGEEQDESEEYGLARGMYQYEPESAKTAYTRANTALRKANDNPKDTQTYALPWLTKLKENDYDVVKAGLTAQEQTDLFVLNQLEAPIRGSKGFIAATNDIVNATSADAMSEEAYNYWLHNHHGTDFGGTDDESATKRAQSRVDWLTNNRNDTHTLIGEKWQQINDEYKDSSISPHIDQSRAEAARSIETIQLADLAAAETQRQQDEFDAMGFDDVARVADTAQITTEPVPEPVPEPELELELTPVDEAETARVKAEGALDAAEAVLKPPAVAAVVVVAEPVVPKNGDDLMGTPNLGRGMAKGGPVKRRAYGGAGYH